MADADLFKWRHFEKTIILTCVRWYLRFFEINKWSITLRVLETERLILRLQSTDDAEFILKLLNEPSWLRFIGDRGIRTIEDARTYILKGPVEMYAHFGFCLYLVELK